MRLKPEQMRQFRALAERWRWSDTDLGSRLVDFLAMLDPNAQQLILGLPIDTKEMPAAIDRMIQAIMDERRRMGEFHAPK